VFLNLYHKPVLTAIVRGPSLWSTFDNWWGKFGNFLGWLIIIISIDLILLGTGNGFGTGYGFARVGFQWWKNPLRLPIGQIVSNFKWLQNSHRFQIARQLGVNCRAF
jgi:hypothetical protein